MWRAPAAGDQAMAETSVEACQRLKQMHRPCHGMHRESCRFAVRTGGDFRFPQTEGGLDDQHGERDTCQSQRNEQWRPEQPQTADHGKSTDDKPPLGSGAEAEKMVRRGIVQMLEWRAAPLAVIDAVTPS